MSGTNSDNNHSKKITDIPLSVLDLAPILTGGSAADAFKNSLDLAQHVEDWGYKRYWLAEHHNMPGIASSATAVVIGYIASATSTLRVGSGGIMLPNHAPLMVAEQFGTLESMYPGRIDLGLGRAPGTDHTTSIALRRDLKTLGEGFPEQVAELRAYFNPKLNNHPLNVHAVPGEGLDVPIWLLGSSDFSARLAGELGLPFSFASHFAPENTSRALDVYRNTFRPSNVLAEPYVMVGSNVIAADTNDEAQRLSTSQQQQFLSLLRGVPSPLQPPLENIESMLSISEKYALQTRLRSSIIGNPDVVKEKLQQFLDETQADEMIINSQIFDHHARLKSYKIIKDIVQ